VCGLVPEAADQTQRFVQGVHAAEVHPVHRLSAAVLSLHHRVRGAGRPEAAAAETGAITKLSHLFYR
jgi:hypothetical protein